MHRPPALLANYACVQLKASHWLQVSMLESCRDRNVVQFLGSCSDGGQTLLVTE